MSESVTLRLELVAAKAKQLAQDYKTGKLWPGQLNEGLSEMTTQLDLVMHEARTDL